MGRHDLFAHNHQIGRQLFGRQGSIQPIVLGDSKTPPAREIARLMQKPVEEIYKLKQRVLQRLREIASTDSKIKTWRTSV